MGIFKKPPLKGKGKQQFTVCAKLVGYTAGTISKQCFDVQVNNTGFRTFGPITVQRGAGFFYEGVIIQLTSACDDGVSTRGGTFANVVYDIEWQPRCAAVQIDAAPERDDRRDR